MSASIAIAQTSLALCERLQDTLRRDIGWRMTGATARVTALPHGKPDPGSGPRLNVALISVAPSQDHAQSHDAAPLPGSYDLRFLITAHVFVSLHSELLIGGALQALYGNPVLGVASAAIADDDRLRQLVLETPGRASEAPVRLKVEAVDERHSQPGLRLPALIVTAMGVVVVEPKAEPLLLS